jgi:hypothetical protein
MRGPARSTAPWTPVPFYIVLRGKLSGRNIQSVEDVVQVFIPMYARIQESGQKPTTDKKGEEANGIGAYRFRRHARQHPQETLNGQPVSLIPIFHFMKTVYEVFQSLLGRRSVVQVLHDRPVNCKSQIQCFLGLIVRDGAECLLETLSVFYNYRIERFANQRLNSSIDHFACSHLLDSSVICPYLRSSPGEFSKRQLR